jgi:hypothetical protein
MQTVPGRSMLAEIVPPPCSRSTTRSSIASAAQAPMCPVGSRCAMTGTVVPLGPFLGSIAWLGIANDAAFLGEPETNGCAERWIRTLKEHCLWVELH